LLVEAEQFPVSDGGHPPQQEEHRALTRLNSARFQPKVQRISRELLSERSGVDNKQDYLRTDHLVECDFFINVYRVESGSPDSIRS
jgi:hypothetical protein